MLRHNIASLSLYGLRLAIQAGRESVSKWRACVRPTRPRTSRLILMLSNRSLDSWWEWTAAAARLMCWIRLDSGASRQSNDAVRSLARRLVFSDIVIGAAAAAGSLTRCAWNLRLTSNLTATRVWLCTPLSTWSMKRHIVSVHRSVLRPSGVFLFVLLQLACSC